MSTFVIKLCIYKDIMVFLCFVMLSVVFHQISAGLF